jgi:hypothetical protein
LRQTLASAVGCATRSTIAAVTAELTEKLNADLGITVDQSLPPEPSYVPEAGTGRLKQAKVDANDKRFAEYRTLLLAAFETELQRYTENAHEIADAIAETLITTKNSVDPVLKRAKPATGAIEQGLEDGDDGATLGIELAQQFGSNTYAIKLGTAAAGGGSGSRDDPCLELTPLGLAAMSDDQIRTTVATALLAEQPGGFANLTRLLDIKASVGSDADKLKTSLIGAGIEKLDEATDVITIQKNQIQQGKKLLGVREKELAQKDEMIKGTEEVIKNKDEIIKTKDEIIKTKDAAIREGDEKIASYIKATSRAQLEDGFFGFDASKREPSNNRNLEDASFREHLEAIANCNLFRSYLKTKGCAPEDINTYAAVLADMSEDELFASVGVAMACKIKSAILDTVKKKFSTKNETYSYEVARLGSAATGDVTEAPDNYVPFFDKESVLKQAPHGCGGIASTVFDQLGLPGTCGFDKLLLSMQGIFLYENGNYPTIAWSDYLQQTMVNQEVYRAMVNKGSRDAAAASAEFFDAFNEFIADQGASTAVFQKEKIDYFVQLLTDAHMRYLLQSLVTNLVRLIEKHCLSEEARKYFSLRDTAVACAKTLSDAKADSALPGAKSKTENAERDCIAALKTLLNKITELQQTPEFWAEYEKDFKKSEALKQHFVGSLTYVRFLDAVNYYIRTQSLGSTVDGPSWVATQSRYAAAYELKLNSFSVRELAADYTYAANAVIAQESEEKTVKLLDRCIATRRNMIFQGVASVGEHDILAPEDRETVVALKRQLAEGTTVREWAPGLRDKLKQGMAKLSPNAQNVVERSINKLIAYGVGEKISLAQYKPLGRNEYHMIDNFLGKVDRRNNSSTSSSISADQLLSLSMTEAAFLNTVHEAVDQRGGGTPAVLTADLKNTAQWCLDQQAKIDAANGVYIGKNRNAQPKQTTTLNKPGSGQRNAEPTRSNDDKKDTDARPTVLKKPTDADMKKLLTAGLAQLRQTQKANALKP